MSLRDDLVKLAYNNDNLKDAIIPLIEDYFKIESRDKKALTKSPAGWISQELVDNLETMGTKVTGKPNKRGDYIVMTIEHPLNRSERDSQTLSLIINPDENRIKLENPDTGEKTNVRFSLMEDIGSIATTVVNAADSLV